MPATVRDNPDRHRYELEVDGHVAFAEYGLTAGVITFIHTEVPKELGGKGVGSTLARGALEDVRRRGSGWLRNARSSRASWTSTPSSAICWPSGRSGPRRGAPRGDRQD